MRKRRPHPLRTVFLLLALVATLVAAIAGWRTLTVNGAEAIASMDEAERELLARIGRLDRGASRSEVESALGPADHWTNLGADDMGQWNFIPGEPWANLRVYLDNGGASRVRWLKIGHFTYEHVLPEPGDAP